jgi:hypothetical protein
MACGCVALGLIAEGEGAYPTPKNTRCGDITWPRLVPTVPKNLISPHMDLQLHQMYPL